MTCVIIMYLFFFFISVVTIRNNSCGKVLFSQARAKNSVHRGRYTLPPGRPTPPGRHPPDGHCGGRYASHWNAFLLFNVNIKLVSLGIHLEPKTLLLQSKRTLQILYPFFVIQKFVIKKEKQLHIKFTL